MSTTEPVSFPIRFGNVYRLLSKALLEPVQRAHVLGVQVRLRELVVSVDQPVLVAETLADRPLQTA